MFNATRSIRPIHAITYAVAAAALSLGTANFAFAAETCTETCIKRVGGTIETKSGEKTLYDCRYDSGGNVTCSYR